MCFSEYSLSVSLAGPRYGSHLDSGLGCFGTLVAKGSPSSVERLLLIVGGDHAEDDWHILGGVEDGAALGGIVAHIAEVRRATAYHAAYHDYGVVVAAFGHLRCGKSELNRSRHALHGDGIAAISSLNDSLNGTIEQRLGDFAIPSSSHYSHLQAIKPRQIY